MDKTKGQRNRDTEARVDTQAEKDSAKTRSGTLWVREDGAICIDNECITLKREPDGAMAFTLDPDKCACEVRDAIIDTLIESAVSGKGIRLEIKPKAK